MADRVPFQRLDRNAKVQFHHRSKSQGDASSPHSSLSIPPLVSILEGSEKNPVVDENRSPVASIPLVSVEQEGNLHDSTAASREEVVGSAEEQGPGRSPENIVNGEIEERKTEKGTHYEDSDATPRLSDEEHMEFVNEEVLSEADSQDDSCPTTPTKTAALQEVYIGETEEHKDVPSVFHHGSTVRRTPESLASRERAASHRKESMKKPTVQDLDTWRAYRHRNPKYRRSDAFNEDRYDFGLVIKLNKKLERSQMLTETTPVNNLQVSKHDGEGSKEHEDLATTQSTQQSRRSKRSTLLIYQSSDGKKRWSMATTRGGSLNPLAEEKKVPQELASPSRGLNREKAPSTLPSQQSGYEQPMSSPANSDSASETDSDSISNSEESDPCMPFTGTMSSLDAKTQFSENRAYLSSEAKKRDSLAHNGWYADSSSSESEEDGASTARKKGVMGMLRRVASKFANVVGQGDAAPPREESDKHRRKRRRKCAEILDALRQAGLQAKRVRSLHRKRWMIKVCCNGTPCSPHAELFWWYLRSKHQRRGYSLKQKSCTSSCAV